MNVGGQTFVLKYEQFSRLHVASRLSGGRLACACPSYRLRLCAGQCEGERMRLRKLTMMMKNHIDVQGDGGYEYANRVGGSVISNDER